MPAAQKALAASPWQQLTGRPVEDALDDGNLRADLCGGCVRDFEQWWKAHDAVADKAKAEDSPTFIVAPARY